MNETEYRLRLRLQSRREQIEMLKNQPERMREEEAEKRSLLINQLLDDVEEDRRIINALKEVKKASEFNKKFLG